MALAREAGGSPTTVGGADGDDAPLLATGFVDAKEGAADVERLFESANFDAGELG